MQNFHFDIIKKKFTFYTWTNTHLSQLQTTLKKASKLLCFIIFDSWYSLYCRERIFYVEMKREWSKFNYFIYYQKANFTLIILLFYSLLCEEIFLWDKENNIHIHIHIFILMWLTYETFVFFIFIREFFTTAIITVLNCLVA